AYAVVPTLSKDVPAIRAERDAKRGGIDRDREDFLAARSVPDSQDSGLDRRRRDRGEVPAVRWAERHTEDVPSGGEGPEELAARRIPEPQGLVITSRENALAFGAVCDTRDVKVML